MLGPVNLGLPVIASQPIPLTVKANQAVTIPHGLSRQLHGWLVIWSTAPVHLSIVDPLADTSQQLVLMPDQDAIIKLVLL